ncbi:MAG: hypothetical protein ACXWCG_09805 [Flavitalea sp.]
MDLSPFQFNVQHRQQLQPVEVRPCCKEDDILYYDIWINNLYQFTITPGLMHEDKPGWRIVLKNADKLVDNDLIQTIGVQIESHFL